jgi:nucleoside 2-deoxyribosyltransferase
MARTRLTSERNVESLGSLGHCYVMMPLQPVFENRIVAEAIDPALHAAGLDRLGPRLQAMDGRGVFDEITRQIARAQICIADLTGNNANVAAEVGIAIALGKPLVLITQDHYEKVPFDFKHLCVLQYSPRTLDTLCRDLTSVLEEHSNSAATDRALLRQMLVPKTLAELEVGKTVVAASPLSYREARRSTGGYKGLRRTSADNVGIRGLLRGFGALYALNFLPELVNPGDFADEVLTQGAGFNLYAIGSSKANRWTGLIMNELNKRWAPTLTFVPDPASDDLRDVRVLIHRKGQPLQVFGPSANESKTHVEWDYGIIIRAPNPFSPGHMAMVLAGRSALGTQAACMVATEAVHLRRLHAKLTEHRPKIELDDHTQPFVAVVHMSAIKGDEVLHEPDPSSLDISSVELLVPRSQ